MPPVTVTEGLKSPSDEYVLTITYLEFMRLKKTSSRYFNIFTTIHEYFQEAGTLSNASKFLRHPKESPPIKIAIVDNGIDRWQDTILGNIKEGRSFACRGDRALPWFTASHAHGTHMASLIRKVNPICDLYIYRVNSLVQDIDAEKAALVRILKPFPFFGSFGF